MKSTLLSECALSVYNGMSIEIIYSKGVWLPLVADTFFLPLTRSTYQARMVVPITNIYILFLVFACAINRSISCIFTQIVKTVTVINFFSDFFFFQNFQFCIHLRILKNFHKFNFFLQIHICI